MHLLVIITRLHAYRGSSEDEFERDWASPTSTLGGLVEDSTGLHAYWAMTTDRKAGVLVIHGYKGLLGGKTDDFEEAIIRHIDNSGLKDCSFREMAVFKHGEIPELDPPGAGRTGYSEFLQKCHKLVERFPDGQAMYDYSLRGKRPAALEVPPALREKHISQPLLGLIETFFEIAPAVELIVRSMQHIILEVRLWCDLYVFSQTEGHDASHFVDHLSDCYKRLMDDEHWANTCVVKACEILDTPRTLKGYLTFPARSLFYQDEERPETASFNNLFEEHGGEARLDCDENVITVLGPVLERGAPPAIHPRDGEKSIAGVDAGLRVLSARLEALILAAVVEDHQRRKKNATRQEAS